MPRNVKLPCVWECLAFLGLLVQGRREATKASADFMATQVWFPVLEFMVLLGLVGF